MNEIIQTIPSQPQHTEDEIDLIALTKTVWEERKTIIKVTVIFFIIGLFIAIFSPKQYKVTTVMVPQITNGAKNKLGGLSSLAAMAGFNLDMNSGSELSPVIYPQIVQSIPFKKELMQTKLNFEVIDHPITYYDYYTKYKKVNLLNSIKKYTIGLPSVIIRAIKEGVEEQNFLKNNTKNLTKLTKEEKKLAKLLDKTVYLNVDKKDGFISLTTIMPEILATAQLGLKAQNLLQEYIIKFKIEKAQAQLDFVEERYMEKKQAFAKAQKELAKFRDQNKNVSTAIARTEEERLQSEYDIAQKVYTELAKRLENARIQVKEETPIFSIIKPITIPTEKYKPKKVRILFIWTFMGIIVSFSFILIKQYFLSLIKQYRQK